MSAKLKEGGWVLVADGEKALFLENVGDEVYPNFRLRRKEEHENPDTKDQGTDKPGRFSDGPSVQRSAVEDTDWHQLEKERFAHQLAELLYKRAHADKFEQIVIVAGPEVLGDLRKELHPEVAAKVIAEVHKNLTHHPVDKIEKIVQEALAGE